MNKRGKTLGLLTMATIVPMALPVSQVANNKILLSNNNKSDEVQNTAQVNELYNEQIQAINVWKGPILSIGFNKNNTFKILNGGNYLNPYYSENNAMTIKIINSNGKIIYNQDFAGGSYPYSDVNKALSNKSFNYGDIISIINRSNGSFEVNGLTSKNEINYIITKNGLEKLSDTSIKDLKAYYNGNNTVVTGTTKPNTLVNVWIGEKSYKTISSSNGTFKCIVPKTVTPGTDVSVCPYRELRESTVVRSNPNVYKIEKGNIELYGAWGGIYKFANIGFNAYTMKFNVTAPQSNPDMCGAVNQNAYTISLYNKDAHLITSKSFLGATDAVQFKKWMDNIGFKYGDYLAIKSNGLNMSFNGGPQSENSIFARITTNGLEDIEQPTIKIVGNDININSYDKAKVSIKINGENYSCNTSSKGQVVFKIPNNVALNTPMEVVVEKNEIRTMPITVYSSYGSTAKEFSYNMFRYASLSPSNNIALKGDDMKLTSYEPIPLQFSGKTKVVIDVKGNVTGTATVYMNNGASRQYLQTINVNSPTVVNVPQSGALIIDTSNVDYKGNQDSKFNFKINVSVKKGYYRSIPVFDNRGFTKIDSEATSNAVLFNKEIFKPSNINHGAIIIGDHVRMYIPNVGQSLPTTFNAQNTVNWYNETFINDNKLNGLSQNATTQLNKFHTNFLYLTIYTTDNGDGWWTGSGGTSAIPGMFKIGLTTPGWVMFHEVGHIFDPDWADSYLHCEVYSNMYTQETQLKVQGKTNWLFNGLNPKDVESNIGPIFDNYYKGDAPTTYLQQFSNGLYYFTLLKQYFPDYMAKTDDLYRSQWINNTLQYKGMNFLVYAMAKIYHTNIIPSLEMWGCPVKNQDLIKYVVQNATTTTNLVPKENYFNKYRDMSAQVTYLTPKLVDNNYTIQGMVNPNSKVTVQYGGKDYTTTCNNEGKFTIIFPKSNGTIAKVYADAAGKNKGYISIISLSKAFVENNKSFDIISTNAAGGTMAILTMDPEGKMDFESTGGNPDWEATSNPYFMSMKVTDPDGKVTYSQNIYMHSNFTDAKNFLQGKKLPVGTIITFDAPKSNSQAVVAFNDMDKSQSDLTPSTIGSLNEWNIVVTKDGLEYLHDPNVDITDTMKSITINTLPSSKFTITIGNKTYSKNVGNNGDVTIDLPKNLKGGEKITYNVTLGSKKLINGSTVVKGFDSTLTIKNKWGQMLGDLIFDCTNNNIEVQEGDAEVDPYLKGETFKLSLENKQGDIIKSIVADGGDWIDQGIFDTFNNANFKVGDKFIIQYDGVSELSFNKIITANGISPYDVKKSVTVYITKSGLSLIKPEENIINKTQLTKEVEEGISDVNSGKYTSKSLKELEKTIAVGKAILNDSNATQSEVNDEVSTINKAIDGLVKKANTEALEKAIVKGTSDVNSKKYISKSEEVLEKELQEGKTILDNQNATQNEVDSSISAINKAINGLVKKANESTLKEDIAKANSDINSKDYTSDSVKHLESNVAVGKIILNNPDVTQSEVNSEVSAINKAINELKKNSIVKKEKHKEKPEIHKKAINESALKEDIAKADTDISNKAYTPDSVKALESDVVAGKAILNNPKATQSEVNNEVTAINKGMDGLVKRANTETLEKAVAKGTSDVNSKKYTSQSEKALEKALQEGKVVLSNPNTTQNEVDSNVSAINKAINELKENKVVKKEKHKEKPKTHKKIVNESALKEDIAKANTDISSKAYTSGSAKALESDVVRGNTILSDPKATQSEVNSEVNAINKAIDGLVKKANTEALEKAIVKGTNDVNSKKYTSQSEKALEKALQEGKVVLSNPNTTQNEVDNNVSAINKAISELNENKVVKKEKHKEKPKTHKKTINESALKEAIAKANADIASRVYTPNSVKPLESDVMGGNTILGNLKATQSEVNSEVAAINKAINGLVKKVKVDNKIIKNQVNEYQLKTDIVEGQNDINSDIYTPDSLDRLEKAINNGQEVLSNKKVTQEEVDKANESIINALDKLKEKGNKEQLKNAIKSAINYINSNNYTSNSVDNLKNSIENAKADLNNPNLTEGEVKNDIKAINKAIGDLTTNETGLKGAIVKAQAQVGSNKYTPNSVKSVKVALSNGEKLLQDSKVTPQEVQKAESSINNALSNLVYRANTLELEKVINNAKNDINSGSYTKESTTNLVAAVKRGQALLQNLNVTQAQINNEVNNIENAINGLKKIIVTPKKSEVNNNSNNEPKKIIDNHNDNQVKKSINTSELKNLIKSGERYINTKKYTEDSIKALESAIKSGDELLNTTNIAQNEVNNEVQVIERAIKSLELNNVDKNPVVNNKGEQINKGQQTNKEEQSNKKEQGNKEKQSNVTNPEKVTNKPQSTTKKILVNKSGLKKLIEKGESDINSGSYTPESVKPLEDRLNNGKELLNNSNVTKEQVNSIVNSINKAIDGLKVNKGTLKNEIAKAKSIVSSKKYSKSSVENIEKAIDEGEGLLNNNSATPVEIHNASTNITNSINELPDTGLNNNNRTVEGAVGMLGAMVAALSALFIFKKRK